MNILKNKKIIEISFLIVYCIIYYFFLFDLFSSFILANFQWLAPDFSIRSANGIVFVGSFFILMGIYFIWGNFIEAIEEEEEKAHQIAVRREREVLQARADVQISTMERLHAQNVNVDRQAEQEKEPIN
ncbi:MAG: hypothetical protein E6Q89_05920 [Bacteroidia bacterium]|nr:MAG: hypothetical protein E6Q89_05920 [Bacteroidia bacterium]